jgi:two-component system response regulator
VVADDDADDQLLIGEALAETVRLDRVDFVDDGAALLDYLNRRGAFTDLTDQPLPSLILLDLNMPRMDGREVLAAIKQDPELRRIPVLVFSTSTAPDDVRLAYELGGNSYIAKPGSYGGLVDVMSAIGHYWFEAARLPAP